MENYLYDEHNQAEKVQSIHSVQVTHHHEKLSRRKSRKQNKSKQFNESLSAPHTIDLLAFLLDKMEKLVMILNILLMDKMQWTKTMVNLECLNFCHENHL